MSAAHRLAVAYLAYLVLYAGITSTKVGYIFNRPYVGPVGFNAFPLVLIGILLGFFYYAYRSELRVKNNIQLSAKQYIWAAVAVVLMVLLSFWATHPLPARFEAMHAFIRSNPVTGGPLLAASLYTALFLPLPFLLFFALPSSLLTKLRKPLLFGILLFIAYLYANVLEAYFHLAISPTVFAAVEQLLSYTSQTTTSLPSHLRLQLDTFSVVIGPVCTGFTMFTLFTGLYLYMWHEYQFEKLRAILALVIGIFVLFAINIIRIAAIVIIGTKFPGIGVSLFHGTIGSILFFAVFMTYLFWVTKYLRIK